jgi:hypothetical protein
MLKKYDVLRGCIFVTGITKIAVVFVGHLYGIKIKSKNVNRQGFWQIKLKQFSNRL